MAILWLQRTLMDREEYWMFTTNCSLSENPDIVFWHCFCNRRFKECVKFLISFMTEFYVMLNVSIWMHRLYFSSYYPSLLPLLSLHITPHHHHQQAKLFYFLSHVAHTHTLLSFPVTCDLFNPQKQTGVVHPPECDRIPGCDLLFRANTTQR